MFPVMLILAIFSLITAVALPSVKISPMQFLRITSITLLMTAMLSYNATQIQAIGSGVSVYNGLFQVTSVSQSIDTFIFVVGAVILVAWAPMKESGMMMVRGMNTAIPTIKEYPLIVLFTTCGASFFISSSDLVSLYLSIELQSFAVYILATLYRDSESATSAGLKYFLLGGLSSGLILFGSALIYRFTGLTNLESIFTLLSVGQDQNLIVCTMGFIVMVIGFFFKIAAAPFHHWAPDVYDGVPTIVTTWLTIMPKISIFGLLLELQMMNRGSLMIIFEGISIDVWKGLLLTCSLLSLTVGTIVGLAQTRIKRLLAYSTISHVGFLLLALGINSEESIESFLFYLAQYSITNLNAFLVVLALGYTMTSRRSYSSDVQFISDLKGQFKTNPLLALTFALCLFSMAGVPPFIGFFGKQMILYSATHNGYYFLSLVGIIVSVISASYYLKIVRVIHFDPSTVETSRNSQGIQVSNVHSFAIATLTLIISLYILYPSIILNSVNLLALTLFNF